MQEAEAELQNISDTALWVAVYRARESARSDAVFHDPLAARLSGPRGEAIAKRLAGGKDRSWPFVARTWLFDRLVDAGIRQGADLVINLAAGLDTRPYRMELSPALRWIEADLPVIIDYKETVLRDERPRCAVERIRIDLSDRPARNAFLERAVASSHHAIVITEGLLIYLTSEQNATLARDLAALEPIRGWALDVASPGLLRLMQKQWGGNLDRAAAPLQFAPAEGVEFWKPLGWKATDVNSVFATARKLKRLPFPLSLFALLPEPKPNAKRAAWSGICWMERT